MYLPEREPGIGPWGKDFEHEIEYENRKTENMSTEQAPIDVESTIAPSGQQSQTQALAVREQGGAVGRALPLEELKANLDFIKQVMQSVMKEGQDYGKIPGCGEKPCLMQPGAQKLLMTFQLTDHVKKEVLREYPNWHREYEFTVCVRSANGKEWDGVGTCSTLESKYRYRKAERLCPECHKPNIIIGKAEFGGGFLCWKKKGGCGAKFADNDQRITSQPTEDVENEDSADNWNTVRKMAFKRALVAAAINATNTSELWTQDLDERAPSGAQASEYLPDHEKAPPAARQQRQAPPSGAGAPPASQRVTHTPPPAAAPTAAAKAPIPAPTEESRAKMIAQLQAGPGQPNREIVWEYFIKADMLLPTEAPEDLPLRWVPATTRQMQALANKLSEFGNGGQAAKAFEPNEEPLPPKLKKGDTADLPKQPPAGHPAAAAPQSSAATSAAPGAASRPSNTQAGSSSAPNADPDWFWDTIVPIPHKGQKRDEYLRNPDTIRSLYELRHGNDEEAKAARTRLWGFTTNFEPKGWTKSNGQAMPPSDSDYKFREALDAFADWFERNHPGEKL